MTLELRLATAVDLPFLAELAGGPLVAPYLSPGAGEPERLEAILARGQTEGPPNGLFVIQAADGDPLGGLALTVFSERSRICDLSRLMIRPDARRSGAGTAAVRLACRYALIEHGFHRLQAESYGDNLAAQRCFERAGFVREGVRRRAYWRRDQWLGGVMFGILADEV